MKKPLLILLSAIMLFSFTGCESDDDSQELSKVESELAEIGEVLGKVANDYLNANITKSEAEEKLDMLESRVSNAKSNATDTTENYGDISEETQCLWMSIDIGSFQYDLLEGKTDKIIKIRDEYYKE